MPSAPRDRASTGLLRSYELRGMKTGGLGTSTLHHQPPIPLRAARKRQYDDDTNVAGFIPKAAPSSIGYLSPASPKRTAARKVGVATTPRRLTTMVASKPRQADIATDGSSTSSMSSNESSSDSDWTTQSGSDNEESSDSVEILDSPRL
jgi:hypothetical protein